MCTYYCMHGCMNTGINRLPLLIANLKLLCLTITIVLFLLQYNQMFHRIQFLAVFFSSCVLSLCLPLLIDAIIHHAFANDLQLQMCTPLTKYPIYFTLRSHVWVMSKLGQLRICLDLMKTRQNSCLSSPKKLSISIIYLLQSLLTMLKFPSSSLLRIWDLH